MNYVKALLVSLLSLILMFAAYFWCFASYEYADWWSVIKFAGLTAGGLLMSKFGKGILVPIGSQIMIGAILGGAVPVINFFLEGVSMWDGFFGYIIAYVIFTFCMGLGAGCLASGLKNALFSLLSLNFYGILISAMLSLSGMVIIIVTFTNAQNMSFIIALLSVLGLGGGISAKFVSVPTPDDTVVTTSDGQRHYVLSKITDDRVFTTDGKRLYRTADGNYTSY